jgi:hypothetical protein
MIAESAIAKGVLSMQKVSSSLDLLTSEQPLFQSRTYDWMTKAAENRRYVVVSWFEVSSPRISASLCVSAVKRRVIHDNRRVTESRRDSRVDLGHHTLCRQIWTQNHLRGFCRRKTPPDDGFTYLSILKSFSLRLSSDYSSLTSPNPGPPGLVFLWDFLNPRYAPSVECPSCSDSYLDRHLVASPSSLFVTKRIAVVHSFGTTLQERVCSGKTSAKPWVRSASYVGGDVLFCLGFSVCSALNN